MMIFGGVGAGGPDWGGLVGAGGAMAGVTLCGFFMWLLCICKSNPQ